MRMYSTAWEQAMANLPEEAKQELTLLRKEASDLDELLCELRDTVAKDTSRSQFDQLYDRFLIAHEVSESKGYYSEGREDYLLDIETLLYNLDHFIEEKSSRTYNLTHYFKIYERRYKQS